MPIQKLNHAKITATLILQRVPAHAFNPLFITFWLTYLNTEKTEGKSDHVLASWQIYGKKGAGVVFNLHSIRNTTNHYHRICFKRKSTKIKPSFLNSWYNQLQDQSTHNATKVKRIKLKNISTFQHYSLQ